MRLPVINCFEYKKYFYLYNSFGNINHKEAYSTMNLIKNLDFINYRKENEDEIQKSKIKAKFFMDKLPQLNKKNNELQAAKFAKYGVNLQFEFTYLISQLRDHEKFNKIISIENIDKIQIAGKYKGYPIFLPIHMGPSYILPVILSKYIKTATMYNKMNFDELVDLNFKYLKGSIKGIDVNKQSNIVKTIVNTLKKDRSITMFPEYNPKGIGNHYKKVSLFGGTIKAPTGPAILSYICDSPLIPVKIDSKYNGEFNVKICDLIEPCSNKHEVNNTIDKLWKIIEEELRNGNYGEWEMWCDFEKILYE